MEADLDTMVVWQERLKHVEQEVARLRCLLVTTRQDHNLGNIAEGETEADQSDASAATMLGLQTAIEAFEPGVCSCGTLLQSHLRVVRMRRTTPSCA